MSTLTAQNVLCNRLHSVEQRLAKWLLLVQDRVKSEELELTHEFIATMLGSRREAVTLAASSLREVGLISYRRGFVTILDRVGPEHWSLEHLTSRYCRVLPVAPRICNSIAGLPT